MSALPMAALTLALRAVLPGVITVATASGEQRLPVRLDVAPGLPMVAATPLVRALGGTLGLQRPWADLAVAGHRFRFLLDAPVMRVGTDVVPLAAAARERRDTLWVPLQFATELLPRYAGDRFTWEARRARLAATPAQPDRPRLPNGLLPGHTVTIDPGHGGVDPGNPGLYFPRHLREKDVTLAVGLLLREELQRRGIQVRMTRVTDTLIDLGDRGGYCQAACDLFVSLHVNSLPRRAGASAVRGFETYFLAEAKTEDAERVARMENEAIRFEAPKAVEASAGLEFILKDLQLNEHLRESARAAELVQEELDKVHGGDNRGVKQAGFMVLNTARRPAILVEMGYSTNPEDGRLLTGRESQRTLAHALADAVVAYLRDYERKTGAGGPS